MADSKQKKPVHRRPRYFLFILYLVAYGSLRMYGDIVSQTTRIQVESQADIANIVAPDPTVPHWRQQVYRGVFSPCMVMEEEIKKASNGNGGIFQDAVAVVRDMLQI